MKECDQKKLLNTIQSVSFAMEDVRLYLDTHVGDKAAIEYYEAYKKVRERLVNRYNRYYAPIDSYCVKEDEQRIWYLNPWPWEGD